MLAAEAIQIVNSLLDCKYEEAGKRSHKLQFNRNQSNHYNFLNYFSFTIAERYVDFLKHNQKLLKANNALVKGLNLEQQQPDDNNDDERSSPYMELQHGHPPSSSSYWHQLAEAKTLSKICRLFPFLAMKVVRLRLSLVNDLLTAPRSEINYFYNPHYLWKYHFWINMFLTPSLSRRNNNLKVLYLVRDPRAVSVSRASERWCSPFVDCISTKSLCADMVEDFKAASFLRDKYPDRFL
jgi:hypothetical protein